MTDPVPELRWTGERCLPFIEDVQVVYEHLLRYHFAIPYCAGKRVIDLGSGEGYGAALLAESAESVVGIEIDREAVEHAAAAYRNPKLRFIQGSVLELNAIPTGSIDAAVCFEVLEHVREQEELLAGVDRILAPGGLLLISTPDRRIYTEKDDYHNPYHLKELDPEEFEALLRQHFKEVVIWRQRITTAGSRMSVEVGHAEAVGSSVVAVKRVGNAWVEADVTEPYLLAVAGETLPADLPAAVELVDTSLEIVGVRIAERDRAAQELLATQLELKKSREAEAQLRHDLGIAQDLAEVWKGRHVAVVSTRSFKLTERALTLIGRRRPPA